MQESMADSAKIAVALIAAGFVLLIVLSITMVGKDFLSDFVNNIDNTYQEVNGSELDALMTYNDSLPAASAYVAIYKNKEMVRTISGTAYTVNVTSIDDLQLLFKYKIKLAITINNDDLSYNIVVSQ